MSEDLNKHRQVKSVDSKSNTESYDVDSMPNFTGLILYLMKKYPNDAELGKNIREAVLSWKEE